MYRNDYSNYETDERYEKEFVLKEFILNFIISFTPLIYVGIFKAWFGQNPGIWNPADPGTTFIHTCQESCLSEISIQIVVIQVGLQYARQFFERNFAF
jgi:hypothetical protein